jgi:hypothetical protein
VSNRLVFTWKSEWAGDTVVTIGQLLVYLRLLDVPVPSVYGPSADENPFA